MAKANVLVVDDEEDILSLVRYNLEREGFSVITARSGEQAVTLARSKTPDLVVLDLMLPGLDGLEVCRTLKRDPQTKPIPVIMLTAKGAEADIVAGLEIGADDYLTKPFSPRVLVARVAAVLRRAGTEPGDDKALLQFGDLAIDPNRHEVLVGGEAVELTATEFRLLHYLAKRPGWVFTRDQILHAVQTSDWPVTDRTVDVHVVALRKKLGACAAYIETVRGVGYRFTG